MYSSYCTINHGLLSHAVALQVTYNVLIMVCIDNQQLDRAGEVHDLSIQAGLHPDAHAYNALINAYGSKCQVSPALILHCTIRAHHLPCAFQWKRCAAKGSRVSMLVQGMSQQHSCVVCWNERLCCSWPAVPCSPDQTLNTFSACILTCCL